MNTQPHLRNSKKAKALLIALANLNAVYFACARWPGLAALAPGMITAIMALAGIYIGGQAAVDSVAANRNPPTT